MNWIFGDSINTDLITPGRYNLTTDPVVLKNIAFIEYFPEFNEKVKSGDCIIAGKNFGCGSSRETAVVALKTCGIQAIFAKSFARIFYRNCLTNGLLAIQMNTDEIKGCDLDLDVENKSLIANPGNKTIILEIPEIMLKLYKSNGITHFFDKYGINALEEIF